VTASGGAGNDTLGGAGSSEVFLGGSGNDTITPGGGTDVVFGEEGDDHVNVRDHTADVAFGGDGNDTVVADQANLDVLEGFESVDRTPGGGPPPVTPPPVTPPPVTPPPHVTPPPVVAPPSPVAIKGGKVDVRKGRALIRVTCPANSGANCTGSLVLRAARSAKVARHTIGLQLGRTRYDLRPGRSRTLQVTLAKASNRLAGRNGRLAVVAVATTVRAGKAARTSQHLTLVLRSATQAK
jgi:Ca2+-binding RTX toxin-like protein